MNGCFVYRSPPRVFHGTRIGTHRPLEAHTQAQRGLNYFLGADYWWGIFISLESKYILALKHLGCLCIIAKDWG